MKKLFTLFIGLTVVFSTFAQWSKTNHALLSGSETNAMVYTGTSVIIATDGGIFRSTDNGNTWAASNTGLDTTNIGVFDLSYFDNKVWAAGNGLYFSDNDGATWAKSQLTGISPNGWINSIGSTNNRIFAMYHTWDNILNMPISILCYSNNGTNWSYGDTLDMGGGLWWNEMDDNSFAYFMTNSIEDTLFYTTNGVSKNFILKTGLPANAEIKSRLLSIDPLGNNLFYNDEDNASIYVYNFNTQTWQQKVNGLNNPLAIFGVYSLGDVAFASAYFVQPIPAVKLYRTLDTANTWTEVASSGLLFPMFQNVMIKAANNRILATELFKDLYVSDNNGLAWTKNSNIQALDFTNIVALSNGTLFTQRDNAGFLKSIDNGTTWVQANGNLPSFFGLFFGQEVITDGTNLLAISSQEPDGPLKMYKSTDQGATYTQLTSAPDSSRIYFKGAYANKIFAFFRNGNNQGSYQFTTNLGDTWTNMTGITTLNLDQVSGFVANNDTIYLFGRDINKNYVIYRSTNNGSIFTPVIAGLNVPNVEFLIDNEGSYSDDSNPIAAFGDNNTGIVIAAINYNLFPNKITFFGLNAAQNTWLEITTNGIVVPHNVSVNSLQYKSGIWYLATSLGLYASADNLMNWERVWNNQGLQLGMQNGACVINGNNIFLGTYGAGIWKTQITQPAITTAPVANITGTQAQVGGIITNIGGLPFKKKGVCYATTANPTVFNNVVFAGTSFSNFTQNISGLTPSTPYYVKAFIMTNTDTIYGNEVNFTTNALVSAQLLPVSGDYGLSNPSNVSTGILWNDASSIASIVDNQPTPYTLTPADYFLVGNQLFINQSYLSTVLNTAGQSITLTVNFNLGNPATFIIYAVQTLINHAQITPPVDIFDIANPSNYFGNITWNDATQVLSIVDNQGTPYTLVPTNDYLITGTSIVVYQSYLESVLTAAGQNITLTVNFDVGNAFIIELNAIETIIDAVINPMQGVFYVNGPSDVTATITWNDASSVTQIVDNQTPSYTLTANDYTVSGNTLTFHVSYLLNVIPNLNDSVALEIFFDKGQFAKFKIKADWYVGLHELTNKAILYPNPAKDFICLFEQMPTEAMLIIYDMTGKMVYESLHKDALKHINVSALDNGTYILKQITKDGAYIYKFNILK